MSPISPQVDLECYVRATATGPPVDAFLETVETYQDEGLVEECVVEYWPREIPLTELTAESPIRAHYRTFQEWADSVGVSLEPAFTRRERTRLVNDTSETVLVLPVVCLAVHVDGELVSVAPHTTGRMSYSVSDALEDIVALHRDRATDIDNFPPDHPVRSVLASLANRNSGTPGTDPDTILKRS